MTLNEEIVQRLDIARKLIQKVYENLDPESYVKFYQDIWKARAEIEYIVISLKLLNNLQDKELEGKWKEEFTETLKQVRAERKVRQVFIETLELFKKLESIENIIEFYKTCWKLKEKVTILLNIVKPKIKVKREKKKSK